MMKRLTEKAPESVHEHGIEYLRASEDYDVFSLFNKLGRYEDLEEQGYRMVNIDKVVERLEVLHDLVRLDQKLAVSQAIEIVKGGAV